MKKMKVFVAGVMQGNRKDNKIYSQDYRMIISQKLFSLVKHIEIIDPDKTDPERLFYTQEQASEMFFRYSFMAGKVDLLIAYIPEASMGSAVEMWEAWKNKVPIVTISPIKLNWVVKLLSNKIYTSLDEFLKYFNNESLDKLMKVSTKERSQL